MSCRVHAGSHAASDLIRSPEVKLSLGLALGTRVHIGTITAIGVVGAGEAGVDKGCGGKREGWGGYL